jgi:D-alanyl-D-alanine dipeptidase
LPGIVLDLKYSTTQNFTKTKLYKKASTTYLRLAAAAALKKVYTELAAYGYNIKVFDAYRPYSATKQMWELIRDERYVANPKNGSNHNRGLAIDLTLIDNKGKEVNMGTDFDNFTDTAHHSFAYPDPVIRNNRKLLKTTMEKNGFKALETEWWHYSYISGTAYTVLDIDFAQLKKWIK